MSGSKHWIQLVIDVYFFSISHYMVGLSAATGDASSRNTTDMRPFPCSFEVLVVAIRNPVCTQELG